MHCGYLGITKKMLSLPPFKSASSIGKLQLLFDKLLVPTYISRKPRSVSDIHAWKATELKNFLFYYLPSLRGIASPEQLVCFSLLSTGIKLLCGKIISEMMIRRSNEVLENFQIYYEQTYTKEYCSSNVHDLIHLPDQVRNFGGLQNSSAFVFEDFIGCLRSWVNGTTSQGNQIEANYLIDKHSPDDISGFEFLQKRKKSSKLTFVGDVGFSQKPATRSIGIEETNIPNEYKDHEGKCQVVQRISIKGTTYHSKSYDQKRRCCNYFAYFRRMIDGSFEPWFGDIHNFIIPVDASNERILAEIQIYEDSKLTNLFTGIKPPVSPRLELLFQNDGVAPFFYGLCKSSERMLIDVSDLISLAIKVPIYESSSTVFASVFNDAFDAN